MSYWCTTSGSSPLGPIGTGVLGSGRVSGRWLLPSASPKTVTISGVDIPDISGDGLPFTTGIAAVQVMKCPDFDNDRRATLADVNKLKKAIFGLELPIPDEDVDNDGNYTIADLNSTLKMYFVGKPQPLRCLL
jgi:hypothetical protein